MDDIINKYKDLDFFIWSNARPYDNDIQYAEKISKDPRFKSGVNVFINGMYPFHLAEQSFPLENTMTFHMECDKDGQGWGWCHGGESLKNTYNKIPLHFIRFNVNDVHMVVGIDEQIKRFITKPFFKYSLIDYPPKSAKYGASGGFSTYQFITQYFKPSKTILVNFCIDDGWKEKYKGCHNLDFESKYYKDNNICQIKI